MFASLSARSALTRPTRASRARTAGRGTVTAACCILTLTGCGSVTPAGTSTSTAGSSAAPTTGLAAHTTTVTPTPLSAADLSADTRPEAINVCQTLGLDTAEVAAITGTPLASVDPVSPGNRPEMCVYGGLWSDQQELFNSLGRATETIDAAETSASGAASPRTSAARGSATASPSSTPLRTPLASATTSQETSTSATSALSSSPPATAAAPLLDDASVFVSAVPTAGRGTTILADIASAISPTATCTDTQRSVPVPPRPTVSATSAGQSTSPAAGATTTTRHSTTTSGLSTRSAPATTKPARTITLEYVLCTTAPEATHASSPQMDPQMFFLAADFVWQLSTIVPRNNSSTLEASDVPSGLVSLAAFISNNVG